MFEMTSTYDQIIDSSLSSDNILLLLSNILPPVDESINKNLGIL